MHTPTGFTPSHSAPSVFPGTALAFAYSGNQLLVAGSDDAPTIPLLADLERAGIDGVRHYLGRLQGVDCVAVALPDTTQAPDVTQPPDLAKLPGAALAAAGLRSAGLRSLFFRMPDTMLALAARAYQVVEWDRTHRYCGRCGTPTRQRAGERAKECPACGYVAYPRVSPAMMVLVTRGRDVLLARANRFASAMYSALAGFVEPGETIEDCVHREVREEVGIEITGLRYFASQPWAFPHSLMIAYTANYLQGELQPDPAEIADARWFSVDALPELPSAVSIARRLIDSTVAELRAQSGGTPMR